MMHLFTQKLSSFANDFFYICFFVSHIELQLLEVLVLEKGRPKKLNCSLELDDNQEEKLNTRGNSRLILVTRVFKYLFIFPTN